jgi:hypothetical protein
MRAAAGALLVLVAAGADAPPERFGVAADLKAFPQATPQEALASVVKAAEAKRFDYVLAQLADPAWVDDRVKRPFAGDFAAAVEDARSQLGPAVRTLGKFVKDGKWSVEGDRATATLEEVKDRVVRLRKVGDRWFLEHRNTPNGK